MKALYKLLSIGTIGLTLILPSLNMPAAADIPNPINSNEIIAQAAEKPEIILNLAIAKQKITATVDGKQQVSWQKLEDNAKVAPGDVLRYTIVGQNSGKSNANNLAVTQPIPDQMVYKLNSASSKNQAKITYSTDQGKSFVAQPKIKITKEDGTVVERPAPPEAYTHIRWQFPTVTPKAGAVAMYEVEVQ
jgi:uncharacterized repeat protein (TIGR01451 family)